MESTFTHQVGKRLRAVRRQQRLSLEEVEERSGGRWSASAIGAYERGYRNLTLGRLHELADFYGVPMRVLLGEIDVRDGGVTHLPTRIVLDLTALDRHPAAAPVARFARAIALERDEAIEGSAAIRRTDLRSLSTMLGVSERGLLRQLASWNALLSRTATAPSRLDLTDSEATG